MLERDVVKKIKDHLTKRYGATCHKHHGSAFSETGVSDLFGTLPFGRAIYLEVKVPGKKATQWQTIWLEEERKRGAIAEVVCSVDEVDRLLASHGYYPQLK